MDSAEQDEKVHMWMCAAENTSLHPQHSAPLTSASSSPCLSVSALALIMVLHLLVTVELGSVEMIPPVNWKANFPPFKQYVKIKRNSFIKYRHILASCQKYQGWYLHSPFVYLRRGFTYFTAMVKFLLFWNNLWQSIFFYTRNAWLSLTVEIHSNCAYNI